MENRHLPLRGQLYPSHQLHLVWPSGSNSERTTLCPSFFLFHVPAAPTHHLYFPHSGCSGLGWAGRMGQRLSQAADALCISSSAIQLPESEQFLEVSSAVEPRVGPALPHSLAWTVPLSPAGHLGFAPLLPSPLSQPSSGCWDSSSSVLQGSLSCGYSAFLPSWKASEQLTPLLTSLPLPCHHGSPSAWAALFNSRTLQTPEGTLSFQELSLFCLLHVYQGVVFFFPASLRNWAQLRSEKLPEWILSLWTILLGSPHSASEGWGWKAPPFFLPSRSSTDVLRRTCSSKKSQLPLTQPEWRRGSQN